MEILRYPDGQGDNQEPDNRAGIESNTNEQNSCISLGGRMTQEEIEKEEWFRRYFGEDLKGAIILPKNN